MSEAVFRTVHIADIRADAAAQPRGELRPEIVDSYSEDMAAGASFPPLVVFFDGQVYWLADGFHRSAAAEQAGLVEVSCEVRQGGLREAILFSCGANAEHGFRRSNEDKRRAVLRLLNDPEWSRWSDREIARQCRVHHELVGKLRPPSTTGGSASEPRTYTTKHGTVSTMNTAGIGRQRAPNPAPAPEAPRTAEEEPPAVDRQNQSQSTTDNVVQLGGRLQVMPSEDMFERQADAEQSAKFDVDAEEFDMNNVEHRAKAINGALNTFDYVHLTGREYWMVYGRSPARETFYEWVLKAIDTLADIKKEHERHVQSKGSAAARSVSKRVP